MKQWMVLVAVCSLLVLVLAGCSGNNPNSNQPETKQEGVSVVSNGQAASSEENPAEAAYPRTIIDDAGNEVKLEQQPQRIAVLHALYMEYFFALDTPPIASSNAEEALQNYATLQPYANTAEVIDLGSGREINLEKVMEAEPDVIVTFIGHAESIYEGLKQIAPVVLIDYSSNWDEAAMLCAQIIGKENEAQQLIEETKAIIAETQNKMGAIQQKSFALLRVGSNATFSAQGTKNTNYYDPDHGFGLGVPNGYPEDGTELSLEALAEMNPDYIILQHDIAVSQAAVKEKESLAVWNMLDAVKNERILYLDNSLNTGSILAIRLAAQYFSELNE